MTFHKSRLGVFGVNLPTNTSGFVRCSPRRVSAAKGRLRRGEAPEAVAERYGGTNAAVAAAEVAIERWRVSSDGRRR